MGLACAVDNQEEYFESITLAGWQYQSANLGKMRGI
jgi:hypothetical protein